MSNHTNFNKAVPLDSILLVVQDFKVRVEDTLYLEKGEFVQVIADGPKYGDGWFLGRHIPTGEIGRFPYSCTLLVSDHPSSIPMQQFEAIEKTQLLEKGRQYENAPSAPPECGICFEKLVSAYALPCGDVFCEHCISRWLEDSMTCPLDRRPVPAYVKEDIHSNLAPPPPYTDLSNRGGLPLLTHLTTPADTFRPTISWPLERIHGVPRHTAPGFLADQECGSFWRQMKELGRVSQRRRRPIRQPGAIAAVRG